MDREITKEEIISAINEMKKNKSLGPDGMSSEVYKEMPKEGVEELVLILNEFWKEGKVPVDFKDSIIFPIQKKGSKTEVKN